VVREIAHELAGQAAVVQINTEENQATAARFAVRGIPALYILKQGRQIANLSGTRSKQAIVNWFRNNV
jgi:thioredoxin-like negative regulator of GroEL